MRTEDGHLIYKCLHGDRDAFGFLVEKYKAGVHSLAYSRLRNFHDAQDVVQDVFIIAYENLHKLRSWDSFASWLYRIASNFCANHIRIDSRRPDRDFAADQEIDPAESHSISFYRADLAFEPLHEALGTLPDTHHEVLCLHYFGGMTSYEIARFSGVSPAAVRKRISRARELLRNEILETMTQTFEEQHLPASFTLRVMEIVKSIRISSLPRISEISIGLSIAVAIIIAVIGSGMLTLFHEVFIEYIPPLAPESLDVAKTNEITVTIYEQEGDSSMLGKIFKSSEMSVFAVAISIILSVASNVAAEDAPMVDWERHIGGDKFDAGRFVQKINGGYIVSGVTESEGAAKQNAYLVETDENGNKRWGVPYGGDGNDSGNCVREIDNGYIVAGWTTSMGNGSGDVYVIETDKNGVMQWEKAYGGSGYDGAFSIQKTEDPDGNFDGYIISGITYSYGAGSQDIWLVRIDKDGNVIWDTPLGGPGHEEAGWDSIQQTSDGGYIVVGWTRSFAGVGEDVYLVKVDGNGVEQWSQTFHDEESDGNEGGQSVIQTSDGGYFIAGHSDSTGDSDFFLIKTDADGNKLAGWPKKIDNGAFEEARSVVQTLDGGYIIAGHEGNPWTGLTNAFVVKIDKNGNELWRDSYGEPDTEEDGFSIQQTSEGGNYILAGLGAGDIYLVKLEPHILTVQIDIKPGSHTNSVNLGSNGVTPVAVFSTESFDATQIDPETVLLSGAPIAVSGKKGKYMAHAKDINDDGIDDLLIHVETNQINPELFQGDHAILTGALINGQLFTGMDEIRIVPPKGKKGKAAPEMISGLEALPVFPQPANPEIWIPYKLGQPADIEITIFDSRGRLIRSLNLGHKQAGIYTSKANSAYWDGKNEAGESVSSGIYFYSIQAGDFYVFKKLTISR